MFVFQRLSFRSLCIGQLLFRRYIFTRFQVIFLREVFQVFISQLICSRSQRLSRFFERFPLEFSFRNLSTLIFSGPSPRDIFFYQIFFQKSYFSLYFTVFMKNVVWSSISPRNSIVYRPPLGYCGIQGNNIINLKLNIFSLKLLKTTLISHFFRCNFCLD